MKPTVFASAARPSTFSRRAWLRSTLVVAATARLSLRAAVPTRRVVVWSEGTAQADGVYPNDVNAVIAEGLKQLLPHCKTETATLTDPDQGCSRASLDACDVLIWWGHKRHGDVQDRYVDYIVRRVKEEGMGFIALHSAHFAKPNRRLMGTRCSWGAYETDGCKLKIRVKAPNHPIVRGVRDFVLPKVERYSEPYAVPEPEAVPLDGIYVYPDGKEEPARQGLCWTVGKGRMFYFAPGHETYRDFYFPEIQRILANAVEWAAP